MTSKLGKKWRVLGVVGAVFVPSLVVAALSVPFTFKAGDAIKADEVNANFEALRGRLDALTGGPRTRDVVGTLTLPGVLTDAPIRSFSQAIDIPIVLGPGTGGGFAKPTLSDVQVVRDAGDGTPPLDLILNQQKHLATADIVVGNLSVHLSDVVVSRVTVSGVQAGHAQETISLYFSTIDWTWKEGKEAAKTISFDRIKGSGAGGTSLPPSLAYFAPGVAPSADYVPITGYSHDIGCTPSPCKVQHSSIIVQKPSGADTLDTLGVALTTKHTAALDITWFTTATTASHSLTLADVQVSNVTLSTNDDGTLSESDGFAYSTIKWAAGKVQTGWDLNKNSAL